jgi:hypothetical protein
MSMRTQSNNQRSDSKSNQASNDPLTLVVHEVPVRAIQGGKAFKFDQSTLPLLHGVFQQLSNATGVGVQNELELTVEAFKSSGVKMYKKGPGLHNPKAKEVINRIQESKEPGRLGSWKEGEPKKKRNIVFIHMGGRCMYSGALGQNSRQILDAVKHCLFGITGTNPQYVNSAKALTRLMDHLKEPKDFTELTSKGTLMNPILPPNTNGLQGAFGFPVLGDAAVVETLMRRALEKTEAWFFPLAEKTPGEHFVFKIDTFPKRTFCPMDTEVLSTLKPLREETVLAFLKQPAKTTKVYVQTKADKKRVEDLTKLLDADEAGNTEGNKTVEATPPKKVKQPRSVDPATPDTAIKKKVKKPISDSDDSD